MIKQFERTGIKECKNLKPTDLELTRKEEEKEKLIIARSRLVKLEKREKLARKSLKEAICGSTQFENEFNKLINMLEDFKAMYTKLFKVKETSCGCDNFNAICDAYIDSMLSNKESFDFLSLRRIRHALRRDIPKYFEEYCDDIVAPVLSL